MKKKIILDIVPGIEQAVALMLVLKSSELEVLGITLAEDGDGGGIDNKEVLYKALDLGGKKDIPVYSYRGKNDISQKNILQKGKKSLYLAVDNYLDRDYSPHEFIVDTARKYKDRLSIISLAPLSNIARAVREDIDAVAGIKEIISMGGGIKVGNMSPVAELNYWLDSKAAAEVYNSLNNITMLGLNVTKKIIFTAEDLRLITLNENPTAKFVSKAIKNCSEYSWQQVGKAGCVFHAIITALTAADRSLVTLKKAFVQIATEGVSKGECVADMSGIWSNKTNCKIALNIDGKRCKNKFYRTLFPKSYDFFLMYRGFKKTN